jgi:diguanylate cyclase (GGDEF)-like protein
VPPTAFRPGDERVVNNTELRPLAGVLATVYGFDVLLTPVGMLAAAEGGWSFLAVLPLTGMLYLLSRERRSRIDAESEADRLSELAHADDLTGAANRRSFADRPVVEQARAARTGAELSVAIDLDHFKSYNDRFGHPAGDDLLRRIVARAGRRRCGPTAARAAGRRGVRAVAPDASVAAAEVVLERLRGVTPPEITFSAGIATWDGREPIADAVTRADAALYRAKRDGRDRLVLTV